MSTSDTLTLSVVRLAEGQVAQMPQVRVRLEKFDGKLLKETVLGMGVLRVGTSAECTLVVQDPRVSRVHCELGWDEGGVRVRDLASKNGTWFGLARVNDVLLQPPAELRLGDTVLRLVVDSQTITQRLSESGHFGEAIGVSAVMRALFFVLERAALTDQPILLLGESGTGKELLADAIHRHSPRRDGPFVILDCGSLPPSLVEAELFGHTQGAFTGADQQRIGLLEQAHGGTLFLDEIGELPLDLQPRLLRALETRQVRPVGSAEWRPADARVIAATHRNLHAELEAGTFRQDLFYRLAVVEAHVPPLRDRLEDIPAIAEKLLQRMNPPRTLQDLPPHSVALLRSHRWPGNVRELRNVLSRMVIDPSLASKALAGLSEDPLERAVLDLPLREAREQIIAEFEKRYLAAKLEQHGGNVQEAADAMGVSRQLVYRLLQRYELRTKD